MTADPFHSPKRRLNRAKKHILDLDVACKAFADKHPYTRVVDLDVDGITKLHKIKMTEPIPDEITDLVHEATEALRHTLDQAGYACAVLAGKSNPRSSYFPFADSSPELANVIKGRCKDLPGEIVTFFRSFQPYPGGNDPLWAMNKIANAKHTTLVPVGTGTSGFVADSINIASSGLGGVAMFAPRWNSVKQELIFARAAPDAKFNYNMKFRFFIAFGQVPVFAGAPIDAVLGHLLRIVERIVSGAETECRRIGLLKS